MIRRHWRRFFPVRSSKNVLVASPGSVFLTARATVHELSIASVTELNHIIETKRANVSTLGDRLVLLILQAPRAAIAQESMDKHPHGYKNKEKRLYELIDFNDTFVETVLQMPDQELAGFVDGLKIEIDNFCRSLKTKTFSDRQYEAITHGLSREIAVYEAAKQAGLEVVMTSRAADAFGIDMQIYSPQLDRYINADCKTTSSFHFRLKDLVQQGRLAPHQMLDAESKGYWEIVNRGKGKHLKIILLRVSQDELGEIHAFRFKDEDILIERLLHIIELRGLHDGQFDIDIKS